VAVKKRGKSLFVEDWNCTIDTSHLYVLRRIPEILELSRIHEIQLSNTAQNELVLKIDDIQFILNSGVEVSNLRDIFSDHMYDVALPEKSVIIDVGANVADTALYFANRENVEFVRGYEPFEPTFKIAQDNLAINPKLSCKIELLNYGLGDKEKELVCDFSLSHKECVGDSKIMYQNEIGDITKEAIKIKPVGDEVIKMRKEFPDHRLAMKIDCEGAEFEIIRNLNDSGLLRDIDIILMEWHEKNPQEIIATLLENSFAVYNRDNHNSYVGMLYAFKQWSRE
jgi:FkbM family methyltransferase